MSIFAQTTAAERERLMDRAMARACSELKLNGLHATAEQIRAAEALAGKYYRVMCDEYARTRRMLMGR